MGLYHAISTRAPRRRSDYAQPGTSTTGRALERSEAPFFTGGPIGALVLLAIVVAVSGFDRLRAWVRL